MSARLSVVIVVALVVSACAGTQSAGPVPATPTTIAPPTPEPEPTPPPPTPVPPTATPTPLPTRTPTPTCVERLPLRIALAQLLLPLATPGQFADIVALAEARELSGLVILGSPSGTDLNSLPPVDAAGVPLMIASDEEGGRVQRLAHLLGRLPSAAQFATQPLEDVQDRFAEYGEGLSALGLNTVFAPVVDVGSGPGIGTRSFSSDPQVVIDYAGAVIDGYNESGIQAVIKHFPGHGKASADSHLGFATTPPLDELRTSDLIPFMELARAPAAVMVGHLLVPGLTEDLPASLSPAAIDGLLRRELGFDGLVFTDALGMNAISGRWDNAEASILALVAGADIVILESPGQVPTVLDELELAIEEGVLTRAQVDDSVERVFASKATDPCAALAG